MVAQRELLELLRFADNAVERSSTLTIDAQAIRFDANGCANRVNLAGTRWYYHSSAGAQQKRM